MNDNGGDSRMEDLAGYDDAFEQLDDEEGINGSREEEMNQSFRQREREQHSYLPGPSHPLLNSQRISSRSSQDQSISSSPRVSQRIDSTESLSSARQFEELPILELPGVVLFPGSSIPIRLSNRAWIQHLGRRIDESRRLGSSDFGSTVQLGILTRKDETVAFAAVETQHARRRSSLLRRGVRNSPQARRISLILQRELLGDIVVNESSSSENGSDDDDDDDDDTTNRATNRGRLHRAEIRNSHRSSSGNNSQRNVHPFIGRIGTIATITYTHGDAALDDISSISNSNHNGSLRRVWQQHAAEQSELVMQAVGTERFLVHSYLPLQSFADVQVFQVEKFQQDNRPLVCPSSFWTGLRRRLPVNPTLVDTDEDDLHTKYEDASPKEKCADTFCYPTAYVMSHHESLIRQLSLVTPVPGKVLQQVWPWRMVIQMVQLFHSQAGQSGLFTSLTELLHDDEAVGVLDDPTKFSFWLASNTPLNVDEKLALLQVPSTVERLKLLLKHMRKFKRTSCIISCAVCEVPLSRADQVFSVGDAEGTAGNYVNEHGFIYQVVTLREIEEQEVISVGGTFVQNSYFPGYSWTVTYCVRCGALLGWKFDWVGRDDSGPVRRKENEKNRPNSFYGFNASSLIITTDAT